MAGVTVHAMADNNSGVVVYAEFQPLILEEKEMFINTCYINFGRAIADDGDYTFPYNVYNVVKNATALYIINYGALKSVPCIVTKRESGTMVLSYSSTSLYIDKAAPTVISSTDPD